MIVDDLRHRFLAAVRVHALVVPVLVAAALAAIGTAVTTATAVLVLVVVVVAFGATGDRAAGLLAAVSSGAWFDFFLTEPRHTFAVSSPDDVEVVVLLVVVGVVVTQIALRGIRHRERAGRREGYLAGVLETADGAVSPTSSPTELGRLVARRVAEVLEVDRCRFVPDAVPSPSAAVLHRDGTVHRDGVVLDVEREGLPSDVETCLCLPAGRGLQGLLLITAASRVVRPGLEQRRVAVLLADQLASAGTVTRRR